MSDKLSNHLPNRLAIKLHPKAEKFVKQGHPWIFEDRIVKKNIDGTSGDVAVIFSQKTNKVLGVGLWDNESPIRIKLLENKPAQINKDFFRTKIKKAFAKRLPLLATNTNSYRLIFGENDGLPSLIADVYDKVLVVKLYSTIWVPYFKIILPLLIEISKVETAVLRLSRNVSRSLKESELKDGLVVHGVLEDENVVFTEHGIRFSANVIKGHKTGYFLDHRANRKRVGELSKGKKVLDVFSYAGGFSVHALAGGATEVISLDISGQALEQAVRNGKLNAYKGIHKTMTIDAFEGLQNLITRKEQFDIVIIDPPSFAKSATEIEGAKNSYSRLAKLGIQLVRKGGILVLASCSSRILSDEFFEISEKSMSNTKYAFELLNKTFHDIDHPIGFPEGAYLKCGYYRIR